MSGIKSPLSNKSFGGFKLKEFEVPDETDSDDSVYESSQDVSKIDFKQAEQLMAARGIKLDPNLQSEYNKQQAQKRQLSNEELMHLEQELKASKQAKASGREVMGAPAKKRIELLIGASRLTKEVAFDEVSFELRTLKAKELREIMLQVSSFNGTVEFPYELRRQILAHSLFSVAGTDLDLFLGTSALESKLDFVEELDDSLQTRLYVEYLNLKKEAEEKYGLNSPSLSDEVTDDLKK